MPFQARKLRVQLPCSVEGSLVEIDGDGGQQQGQVVANLFLGTCYLTRLDYCACSVVNPPGCVPSGPPPCIEITLDSLKIVPAEQRLVEPDLLPLLKQQLENRLVELDVATQVAKKRTRAWLDDIAVAERALREHRVQEGEPGE
jgi:hypothetical protein